MSQPVQPPSTLRLAPGPLDDWRLWLRRARVGARAAVSGPLYAIYRRRLLRQVLADKPPRHVGLILDGNRRWGQLWGVADPARVYELGARKLDAVLDW